jgi:hypothetical protein
MKKILFSIFLLGIVKSASAQVEPRPAMYGITDTVVSITQLQDSVKNASDMHFVKLDKDMIVQAYTIIYTPVSGAPYIENVKGRSLGGEIKYRIKNAQPGDKIFISNVKMLFNNQDAEVKTGRMYLLQ